MQARESPIRNETLTLSQPQATGEMQHILSAIQSFTEVNKYLSRKLDWALQKVDEIANDYSEKSRESQMKSKIIEEKSKTIEEKSKTIEEKTNEVSKLREEIAKLTNELSLRCWGNKLKKSLLLGDSLVRDIDSNKLENTDVKVLPNGTIKEAVDYLNQADELLNIIYICLGKDVCSQEVIDPEEIKDCYENLLTVAKTKGNKIVVSGILPRLDNEVRAKNVECLNTVLASICLANDITFIDHNDCFMLRHGEINDGYLLPDGLHLTKPGTQRLVKNLNIPTKSSDVCRTSNRSKPRSSFGMKSEVADQTKRDSDVTRTVLKFKGTGNTLSNFYPSNIRVWNMSFASSEHAYQYRKAIEMGFHDTAERIRHANTPRQAQLIAEEIKTDDRWAEIKRDVMDLLLREKAKQCPEYRQDLLRSNDQILVEDTNHNYWGRGRNGLGLNMLGNLHMTIRNELPNWIGEKSSLSPRQTPSNNRPFSERQMSHRNMNQSRTAPVNQPRTAPVNQARNAPMNQSRNAPTYQSRTAPTHRERQSVCHNCSERGHSASTCRLPSPFYCHTCGGQGHKWKFCKNRK